MATHVACATLWIMKSGDVASSVITEFQTFSAHAVAVG